MLHEREETFAATSIVRIGRPWAPAFRSSSHHKFCKTRHEDDDDDDNNTGSYSIPIGDGYTICSRQ